jgi:hypothetical protein
VLYEVAKESSGENADEIRIPDGTTIPVPIGDSTEWQYWVIETSSGTRRSGAMTGTRSG